MHCGCGVCGHCDGCDVYAMCVHVCLLCQDGADPVVGVQLRYNPTPV
jgi:hypothetical protein